MPVPYPTLAQAGLLVMALVTDAQAQQGPIEAPPSPQHHSEPGAMMQHIMRPQAGRFGDVHMRQPGMAAAHGAMMRVLFAAIDADGNGSLSLDETQSVHERVYRHADVNDDGELTLEEIQTFFHGKRNRPNSNAAQ